MTKQEQEIIEEHIYPLIRTNVRGQLDIRALSVAILPGAGTQEDQICFSDGKKMINLAIKTPELVNVSLLVDILALKMYIVDDTAKDFHSSRGISSGK